MSQRTNAQPSPTAASERSSVTGVSTPTDTTISASLRRICAALGLKVYKLGEPLVVPKSEKPLWHEKGWRCDDAKQEFKGRFRAAGRSWRGLIHSPYPGRYTAYIWNPPLDGIRAHTSHAPCFMPKGEAGRYEVYFHTIPSSLSHAITSIEAVLTQACRGIR